MSSMATEPARDPSECEPPGDVVPKEAMNPDVASCGLTGARADSQGHGSWPTPPSGQSLRRSAWTLLCQRDFRLYFFGATGSNLGTWLQSTVQILIAYQITHSVFIVGLITSAQFAGTLLVSPWAAVLADRIGTRTVLIGTQSISAGIALWMAWLYRTGSLGVHALVVGSFGLGLAYALALPVQTALVPALVDPADATSAVKMNSVSYNAARALGPALCVLVVNFIGPGIIFTVNAASFASFAVCLTVILHALKHTPVATGPQENQDRNAGRAGRAHVLDGFKTALQHRRILLLLAIVGAVTFADDPILILSPALAHATLQVSSHWTGYFIAALGWGSVLGSVPPTPRKDYGAKQASRHAAIGLVFLSVSVVIFTMGISAQVSLFAAAAAGAAGLFTGAAAQTALLRHQKQKAVVSVASVAALWAIAWAGTKPFASLLDGWLATKVGLLYASILLVLPALVIAFGEICFRPSWKKAINSCSEQLISAIADWLAMVLARRQIRAAHVAEEIPAMQCDSCGAVNALQPIHTQ